MHVQVCMRAILFVKFVFNTVVSFFFSFEISTYIGFFYLKLHQNCTFLITIPNAYTRVHQHTCKPNQVRTMSDSYMYSKFGCFSAQ